MSDMYDTMNSIYSDVAGGDSDEDPWGEEYAGGHGHVEGGGLLRFISPLMSPGACDVRLPPPSGLGSFSDVRPATSAVVGSGGQRGSGREVDYGGDLRMSSSPKMKANPKP
jgi:hypothetical protein